MFTNGPESLSSAIKLRLIFVANSVAASKHRQAKFRRFLDTTASPLSALSHDTHDSVTKRVVTDKKESIQKVRKLLSTDLVNTKLVCESGSNFLK